MFFCLFVFCFVFFLISCQLNQFSRKVSSGSVPNLLTTWWSIMWLEYCCYFAFYLLFIYFDCQNCYVHIIMIFPVVMSMGPYGSGSNSQSLLQPQIHLAVVFKLLLNLEYLHSLAILTFCDFGFFFFCLNMSSHGGEIFESLPVSPLQCSH